MPVERIRVRDGDENPGFAGTGKLGLDAAPGGRLASRAVVGEREAADGTVAPRIGGENRGAEPLDAFVARTRADARIPGGAS